MASYERMYTHTYVRTHIHTYVHTYSGRGGGGEIDGLDGREVGCEGPDVDSKVGRKCDEQIPGLE